MHSRTLFLLSFLPAAVLFACGGDSSTGSDAGPDATTDGSPGKDAAPDTSTSDSGSPADAGPDVTPGDAGDGGTVVSLTCTNPTECDGGSPFCCGTVTLNGGTPPNCSIASVTAACKAQCTTMLQFSCNASDTVRLCNANTDCTELAYNKCCTFKMGSQTTTFCANQQIANAADAGCM